ncbi:MAG: restriction endonuclease subunit S [Sedimenticola sp.]
MKSSNARGNEWKIFHLAEVTKADFPIVYGIVQPGPEVSDGVPYINTGDLSKGLSKTTLAKTSHDIARQYQRTRLEPGDIVVSLRGSIGEAEIVPESLRGANLARGVARLSLSEEFDPRYVAAQLESSAVQRQVYRKTNGSTFREITIAELRAITIDAPNHAEQRAIADYLEQWNRAINTCNSLIESSVKQKNALTQQLLTGKRRLSGFSISNEIEYTSAGPLPKDWEVVPIGKVAAEVSDRNAGGDALPVLACSKHVGFVNSLEYFKKKVYSDDLTNYKIIRRGQFGFPSNHIEEGSIGLQSICDAGVVSPIYTVFEINESQVDAGFLFKVLKTEHYRQRFAAATNASVDRRGSLRWKGFRAIRIPLPSLKEQQAISAVLDHAAQLEESYKRQREKLEQERRALMQQLLSGRRRVKLPSESITPAKENAS